MLVCENVVEIEAGKVKNLCFLLPQYVISMASKFRRCESGERKHERSVVRVGLYQRSDVLR